MLIRKLLLTVISIFLLSGLAIAGDPPAEHPKTGDPLVIDCLGGTPSLIDGELGDWQLSFMTPAVLDTEEQIFADVVPGAAGWDGPEDGSGEFYVMWDDENIYVAVVMKDGDLSMNKAGENIWNADCIEVFFSTTNAVAGCEEHYQYGFNADSQIWNWCNMDGPGATEPNYMDAAATVTDDGYICEVAIEHGKMKSLDFEVGNTIGFHPVIDDTDASDREMQMTWTGREAHDQSLGYGHIILSGELAAVSYKGKLAATWGKIRK